MTFRNYQERPRKRGALKTIFLAAALFLAPSTIDHVEPSAQTPLRTDATQTIELNWPEHADWTACEKGEADKFVNVLNGSGEPVLVDLASYIQNTGLEFCPVQDEQYANVVDNQNKRISYYSPTPSGLQEIYKAALSWKHKANEYTLTPEFKEWDFKSQLIFRLSIEAKAQAMAGVFAKHEAANGKKVYDEYVERYFYDFEYDVDGADYNKQSQIAKYVQKVLSDPSFYRASAPKILHDIYADVVSFNAPLISPHTTNTLWRSGAAIRQLKALGLTIADIPSIFEVNALYSQYAEQADYLNQKRQEPMGRISRASNRYADVSMTDINAMHEKSGYILKISQMLERARMGYQYDDYSVIEGESQAVQADFLPSQISKKNRHLWHNIQRLDRHQTVIGQLLYAHAMEHNVFFAEGEKDNHAGGTWSSHENMVRVKPHDDDRYSHGYASGTVAHELLHAVQDDRGVLQYSNAWSLQDLQLFVMSYEAAAFITARLVAFELQMGDYDREPWDAIKHTEVAQTIEQEYMKNISGDMNHMEALEHAAAKAWVKLFEDQHWLDTYNKWTAKLYADRMLDGALLAEQESGITIGQARLHGYISPMFNATAHVESLPEKSKLFGDNSTMKQFFDFLDYEYLKRANGQGDSTVLELREKLSEQGNHFFRTTRIDIYNLDNMTRDEFYNAVLCHSGHPECVVPERPNTKRLMSVEIPEV